MTMKFLFILSFALLTYSATAQKQYRATYRDTIFLLFMPGSFQFDQLKEKGMDDKAIAEVNAQLMAKFASSKTHSSMLRKIRAKGDSTLIVFDKSSRTGNLTVNMPDSMLLLGTTMYVGDSVGKGFLKTTGKERSFNPTGSSKKVLGYTCKEYLSTDSTLRIWVAENMPASLNPGVRVGKMKGAIMAFELMSGSMFTKCEMIKLE
jgi:hypothetical protein